MMSMRRGERLDGQGFALLIRLYLRVQGGRIEVVGSPWDDLFLADCHIEREA